MGQEAPYKLSNLPPQREKVETSKILRQANTKEELEVWIVYILKAVEETSKQTISQIQSIRALPKSTSREVKEHAPKIYSKESLERLIEQRYTKIEFITQKVDIERKQLLDSSEN